MSVAWQGTRAIAKSDDLVALQVAGGVTGYDEAPLVCNALVCRGCGFRESGRKPKIPRSGPRCSTSTRRGADKVITNAIDAHVDDERRRDDGDGIAGARVPAS